MSLAAAYASHIPRRAVNAMILAHFDAHGVTFSAARYRVLRQRGEDVEILSKFPETGPRGLSDGSLKTLVDNANIAPQRIEIIDIPIDVRNPDASIRTLADLAMIAPIYYYDHHETDVPFIPRLHRHGIFASVFGDNVQMAAALEILSDNAARELVIIGMVADRDRSVLKLVPRAEVEQRYLPLANRLDVLVRSPRMVGAMTQGDVAKLLADRGIDAIPTNIEYPPEQLAKDLLEHGKVVDEGSISILVDWSDQSFQQSMWTPKTLEQILLARGKYLAIAVTPGFNPRTRNIEGYDVRILRYWLASDEIPVPEEVAKELIQQKAIAGNVVGHADYVSIRFASVDEARRAAEIIYRRVEGMQPTTAHLINERIVAEALKRDFLLILNELKEIHKTMMEMYREYLELKRRQVELLERTQRHEYD